MLLLSQVLIRNTRRPYLQASYLLRSDKTLLGVAAVPEQYHRLHAVRQYILAEFTRTVLATRLEGIIK